MFCDIGSARLNNLLEAFGSAAKIFLNSETKLNKVQNIGSKIAQAIASFAFERLAKELDLPVSIHSREAWGDTVKIVKEFLDVSSSPLQMTLL